MGYALKMLSVNCLLFRKDNYIHIFSRVFRRKNPVIKIGLSRPAGGAFLVSLFADSIFLQSVQPACFKFHTWFLQGLCFHVMPCSFQLVPSFLVKNAFFGDRYFLYFFFTNFCVYSIIPKLFKVFRWTFIEM